MTATPPSCRPGDARHAEGCVTCGDAASWMRVLDVDAQAQTARCVDGEGNTETVATELVGALAPEDRLLVHAGTAIHHEPQGASPRQAGAGR